MLPGLEGQAREGACGGDLPGVHGAGAGDGEAPEVAFEGELAAPAGREAIVTAEASWVVPENFYGYLVVETTERVEDGVWILGGRITEYTREGRVVSVREQDNVRVTWG